MSLSQLKLLFSIGKIISPFYSLAMQIRAGFYARKILASCRLDVPVVSVGNLSMGGTGKTPLVQYLASLLLKSNYKPAVISRGYGGDSCKAVNIVSDGKNTLLGPDAVGDEAVFLGRSLPEVPVLTGKRRIDTGRYVIENDLADLVIMDDGFQHMALQRDINLVLFSAEELVGDGWVFPGGVLREPISALKRATAFLVTGVTKKNRTTVKRFTEKVLGNFDTTPVFEMESSVEMAFLHGFESQAAMKLLLELSETRMFAFCGIAKPQSFFSALSSAGATLSGCEEYPDHHPYTEEDLQRICKKAEQAGCKALITTEKDYVKIQHMKIKMPLWVAPLQLKINQNFDRYIIDTLSGIERWS